MGPTSKERELLRLEYCIETENQYNPPSPREWLENRYIPLRKKRIENAREMLIAYENFSLMSPETYSCAEERIDAFLKQLKL